jgi:dTDP-3-amino-3,4,6-trideoxy-alpha-D-glucose transaminase
MILQNDFKRQWQAVESEVTAALHRVGSSGWYILGREVEAFEMALARFWGAKHAVGVGNGMDALEIALRCLKVRPGEKVITTPLSAFATTLAILRAGARPIFVDVDERGGIDLDQCETVLRKDSSIRFLVPVHLYGIALDLKKLARLRDKFDLRVVEDCAQAIGATDGGIFVGSAGQVAATSFYPTKNLGAFGDGGALLTNDGAVAEEARCLRNYGQSELYFHSELGLNSRLDELHAAMLHDAFLPRVKEWTDRRRDVARRYLQSIRHPSIELLPVDADSGAVWHLFPILVRDGLREKLRQHLRSLDILSGIHYPRIIPEQKALKSLGGIETAEQPVKASHFSRCELSLPVHPFLSEAEVTTVIDACNGWQPQIASS